ncbi:MAG: adenylosuccinate synthetase, partial [Haloechinothrix sp.]
TPGHRESDRSGSGVGSTRMGVGPAYRDKASRSGLRVVDLLHGGVHLPAELREVAAEFRDVLGHMCGDDSDYLREVLDKGGRVVAEGAQGARLDLDHGGYPYVTSSNTTIGAVITGLGIGPRDISTVLMVSPAYVTKVGGGDLPSRVDPELNIYLQQRGRELDGATLQMRDTGWLDAGWLRTACQLNQADGIVLTKVDVLAGIDSVGLYDQSADPALTMHPGWTAAEVSAASEDAALGRFVARVEATAGRPISAVSYGPGLDDWWWRQAPAAPWGH